MPTLLSPWFVVQKFATLSHLGCAQFYTAMDDGNTTFVEDENKAMIFMSLHSAYRVAQAEGAHVRVLASADDVKEFGRA